jgi:hypothetical protein
MQVVQLILCSFDMRTLGTNKFSSVHYNFNLSASPLAFTHYQVLSGVKRVQTLHIEHNDEVFLWTSIHIAQRDHLPD